MKIGFFTYSYMRMWRYWNKLKDKADCWWGTPERRMVDFLKAKNIHNVVHHYEEFIADSKITSKNKYVSTNPGISPKIIAEKINPDIWIADTLNRLNCIPKKAFWVQIFHSLPIKKHFFYPPVLDYDLILLPGEYHKEELVKRLNLDPSDERLKIVGWPRVDDFVNGVFDRKSIMKDAGLDPERKTVMYAPTWGWGCGNDRFFARWFDHEIEVFERLCKEVTDQNMNFIVRLHALSLCCNNKALMGIGQKYKVLWQTNETSNFHDDPSPFMWITDVLISDLSGIIAEFMVLDRPIIYIDPEEQVSPWVGSDMPKNFRVGHVVRTPDELCEAIRDSILYPKRYAKERKELTSRLFFNLDGKATDRAVEAILDFAASKGLK